MTFYEFISLDETEKADAVWEGQFIAFREVDNHMVLLYKIGDFYWEVYYEREENAIVKLRPFKTKKFLAPYLKFNLN